MHVIIYVLILLTWRQQNKQKTQDDHKMGDVIDEHQLFCSEKQATKMADLTNPSNHEVLVTLW